MTRPESHDIDAAAKRIFKSTLPTDWEIRKQSPDYRIDYQVELFQDQQSTGLWFNVQLKGTKSPRFSKSGQYVSFALQSEHLAYYVEKVPLPVFLVVVDVRKKRGWWIFLQQYALEDLTHKPWQKQKSLTVRLPRSNSLADASEIRSAVEHAERFMRDLRPSRVQPAIKQEKARLEELDPRFVVSLRADERATHVHLQAKEKVELPLKITGEHAQQKLAQVVEAGEKVEFSQGEAIVSGSPLFEGLGGPKAFDPGHQKSAGVRLALLTPKGIEMCSLHFQGHWRCGTKRGTFEGCLERSPLTLRVPLEINNCETQVHLGFDISQWSGQRLRSLAYFQEISRFFRTVDDERLDHGCADVQIEIVVSGGGTLPLNARVGVSEWLRDYAEVVSTVEKARRVAECLELDLNFPNHFAEVDIREIHLLHGVISGGEYRCSAPRVRLRAPLSRPDVLSLLKMRSSRNRPFAATFPLSRPLPFLGEQVELDNVQIEITEIYLSSKRGRLEKEARDEGRKLFDVRFAGTSNCEYVLRRVDDAQM